MTFLQIDFVERAVLHPNLERTLNVHLDHLFFFQAVLGQEEFFKNCIIKCFRAQQTNIEQERLANFADLSLPHNWWNR